MSTLTPSTAQGQALFEGSQNFYAHDDAGDSKDSGGAYSHQEKEFSAHEAEALCDWARYLNAIMLAGPGGLLVRNQTGSPIPAGPARITSYDGATSRFLIGLADADDSVPANLLLLTALATATNGIAYLAGTFTADTSARTIGDPAYLSDTGGITYTAPTGADKIQQVIGRVKTVDASGTIAGKVEAPTKIGTSWLQDQTVVYGKTAFSATDKLLGRATSGAGAGEEIACTAAGRAIIDDADAAAQRTTLGLGTIAVLASANFCAWGGIQSGKPGSPVTGMICKDSDDGKYYIWNGSTWDALT